MYSWASIAIDQNARFGLAAGNDVLHQQAVDDDRLAVGYGPSGLGEDEPRHQQAETQRRPVRRQDAPRPPMSEPGDRPEPPSRPGRTRPPARNRTAR